MNLKDKFIWNLAIGISSFAIIWSAWNLYLLHIDTAKLYSKFLSDSKNIGTDDDLESKVLELENNYKYRDNMQFKISSDPADLNRVISLDGRDGSKKRKSLYATSLYTNGKGQSSATMHFKDQKFEGVVKGDSLAGGLVTKITPTEIFFTKNDKEYIFNLDIKNTLE